jgi:hypothetical protein
MSMTTTMPTRPARTPARDSRLGTRHLEVWHVESDTGARHVFGHPAISGGGPGTPALRATTKSDFQRHIPLAPRDRREAGPPQTPTQGPLRKKPHPAEVGVVVALERHERDQKVLDHAVVGRRHHEQPVRLQNAI